MNKHISNKVRCKNCVHFKKTDCKYVGICKLRSNGCTIFVIPNQQIEECFVEEAHK